MTDSSYEWNQDGDAAAASPPPADPTQPARRIRKLIIGAGLWPLLIFGGIFLIGGMARCDGSLEAALAHANSCATAVDLLGTEIHQSVVGCSTGESSFGGGHGRAQWRVTVEGTKGRGTLSYSATQNAGRWQIHAASIRTGGRDVSITPCVGSFPPAPPAPVSVPAPDTPTPPPAEDQSEAVAALQSACEAGDAHACRLVVLYALGRACQAGDEQACTDLARVAAGGD